MEGSGDVKRLEDIVKNESYNLTETNEMCVVTFSSQEKGTIKDLLLEDFKQCLFDKSPPMPELYKKARFVSAFGCSTWNELHWDLRIFIKNHLENEVKQKILSSEKCCIKSLVGAWTIYIHAISTINKILEYMERVNSNDYKLYHFDLLGINLFRNLVFENNLMQNRLVQDLAKMYQLDLFMSNRFLIEDLSKMCTVLENQFMNIYHVIPLILNQSSQYFKSLSEDYLFKYCACGYFKNAEAKIIEETDRIELKFDKQTSIEFVNIMKTELVNKNMKTIVEMENCGVVYMLKNNQHDDLKRMYNFLSSVNGGVKVMFDGMRPYIREVGTPFVLQIQENSDVNTCTQCLLDLKKKFDHLKVNLFDNDTLFDEIVGDEFDYFLKCNPLIPRYLSIFIDQKLRKRKHMITRKITEADVDRVIFMIQYLKDKEKFEYFYHLYSCTRLIYDNIYTINNENKMISKLQCAYSNSNGSLLFISKLEGMVKDKFVLSKMIMKKYNESVRVDKCILGTLQPFDLNVNVINPVNWPVDYPNKTLEIPSFGLNAFNKFKKLYSQYNDQKKLILLPNMGTVEVDLVFYDDPVSTKQLGTDENSTNVIKRVERKITVVITTYQMCVLDLFNTHNTLTYEEIQSETKIPKKSLVHTLKLMVFGKYSHHLLLKTPMAQEIKVTDRFCINESFKCK